MAPYLGWAPGVRAAGRTYRAGPARSSGRSGLERRPGTTDPDVTMQSRIQATLLCALFLSACTSRVETSSSPGATTPATTATLEPKESKVWFEGTFADGLAQARAEKKLVFVDVFATWCAPCKKLEKVTFPHPDVKPVLAQMVSMSIDAESPAGIPVAAKYRVNSYPTMLVLDAGGQEIGRLVGFKEPSLFLADLKKVRARAAR